MYQLRITFKLLLKHEVGKEIYCHQLFPTLINFTRKFG